MKVYLRSPAWIVIVAVAGGCSTGDDAQDPAPWFVEEAAERGLDFEHRSGAAGAYLLPEIMGGGAALFDADGDGDLDAYLVQSDGPNALFVNDGSGRFARSPDAADDAGYGMGVTAGDYDNDGDVDLYVTNVGSNVLLANDGDGTFVDMTEQAGVAGAGFSTAAAFFDADRDGDLDLFVVNYVAWSPGLERDCYDYGTGVRNYCDPGNYDAPSEDRLYRNNGDGSFSDITEASGVGSARGNGLGIAVADLNGDDLPDVFVANDKTLNHMWLNRGDLTFVEDAIAWGSAMDDHGIAKAGMGVASADVDDDLDMDLLVVNIEGETDSLFRNDGDYFVDATARFGLGTTSRRYTRFGIALIDFDNDGRLDLYEANGRVTYSPEPEAEDVFAERNAFYRGGDQGFTAAPALIPASIHTSRGLAYGDVDADGAVDALVINRDAQPYLLMNRAPGRGNWLRIRLLDAVGGPAIGASVVVRVGHGSRTATVQTAGSYLASNDPTLHFGLGTLDSASEVTVRWPTGEEQRLGELAVNRVHTVRQSTAD